MINIENILKNNNEISDYLLGYEKKESFELFFVHKDLETSRKTKTNSVNVTVYVDHDGKRGDAKFDFYDYQTEEDFNQLLNRAIKNAKMINNEFYEIVSDKTPYKKIESNIESVGLSEAAFEIASAVFEADKIEGGSLNATEVFVYKIDERVVNSKGVDKTQTIYKAMVETIPTWTTSKESVELYQQINFQVIDKTKITKEVEEKLIEVRDRSVAVKPSFLINVPVILRNTEMTSLYRSILGDLSYAAKYAHRNLFNVNDRVQTSPNSPLSITQKGEIKGSSSSNSFDYEGVTLNALSVIEDGVVKNNFGSARMSYYFNAKPVGLMNNLEVKAGKVSETSFKSEPYLEVVSMSGIQVDLYNDYIGGEIRLAYYFDGKKVTPVTGISISGKVKENLNTMVLSSETNLVGSVFGPKCGLFKDLKVI